MKFKILTLILCGLHLTAAAQVSLADKNSRNTFTLLDGNRRAVVCYDKSDAIVVAKAASLLSDDVQRVTGTALTTESAAPGSVKAPLAIIAGTIGQSEWIDGLAAKRLIDTAIIAGDWERYLIQTVKNPFPGIKEALVIAGSDRRGTAYGLLSLSRAIGVSPWYWWADAPVEPRKALKLDVKKYVSKTPSVKYRGVFINDEDWGLLPWAKNNFEKEFGNIGPRTYAKVCELLLRLNANHLAPAMHEASYAFNRLPENRLVADTFAIAMGSSHCEPLLFNTASEWHRESMGEWNYVTNRKGIDSVLWRRALELAPFENVYTMALRGLHDQAMQASTDMSERRKALQDAILSQRSMVAKATGKPADQIPQAFTPYKEVLDVYDEGIELPDDITIIWPDDNYGYMKRLSSPAEQKRSGRAGVYYHSSYLGRPHDYLWMNTTSPNIMYEELRKAYDMTADRVWLLNAGDIKSCEFAVDLFLSMAYDIDSFSYERVADYRNEWLCSMLGNEYRPQFEDITDSFYRLAFQRKPECMGWGYQWTKDKGGNERTSDTDFSMTNYREADRRIAEYRRIAALSEQLLAQMPEAKKACFYQTLYYPVKGCELMNRMTLDGQRNRLYATNGRASASEYSRSAKQCYDSLQTITEGYNSLLGGKWNHLMTTRQGFAASYFELPRFYDATLQPGIAFAIQAEGEDVPRGMRSFHALPAFNSFIPRSYYVDVINKGTDILEWTATASEPWIRLSKNSGKTAGDERVEVSVDWQALPAGENLLGTVEFKAGNAPAEQLLVSVFNPSAPSRTELNGLYIEDNGVVSIDAGGFHRKLENDAISMRVIPNLGVENVAVQLGDPTAPGQRTSGEHTPRLEYDFYCFGQGSVDVYTYVLPTFVPNKGNGYAGHETTNSETKYGLCIDDGPVMNPATSAVEYSQTWYESALKNCRINKTTLHIDKPGRHSVKVICGDPGIVLQKIVVDFGGLKRSYMGPEPTRVTD